MASFCSFSLLNFALHITADRMPLITCFSLKFSLTCAMGGTITLKKAEKNISTRLFNIRIGSGLGFLVHHTVIFKGRRVQGLPYKNAWEDMGGG